MIPLVKSPKKKGKEILNHVTSLNKNPKVKKRYLHISLSFPPNENIDYFKSILIARAYMTRMEFDNTPYLIYKHSDRSHSHLHIIASRITYDGKVLNEKNSYWRSMKICSQLEDEFSLIKVKRKRADKKLNNKIVHAEIYNYDNQLEIRKLWSQLDSCKSKSTNFEEYTNEAKKLGVKVKIRYRDEKPYGISYSRYLEKTIKSNRNDNADQEAESKFIIRGQKLGRGYMISGLKETFTKNQKAELTMKTESLEEKVSGLIMQSSSIPQLTMSLNQASIRIVNESQNNQIFIQDDQTIRVSQLNQQTQMHLDFLIQLNLQEARERKGQKRK